MKLYSNSGGGSSGGGGGSSGLTDPYGFSVGGTNLPSSPDEPADAGKGSFSFADPIGSIGDTLGNFGDFLGGIGQIGIPGGPNLGGIAGVATAPVRFGLEAAGNALGAVGSIPLPYLGNDPTRTNARVGDIPGAMLDVIGAPARFVEEQAAKGRLTGNDAGTDILAEAGRHFFGSQTDRVRGMIAKLTESGQPVPPALIAELARLDAQNAAGLPADIQARLDAGESVDALASEMADRGIGFNNDPGANLAAGLVLDPLNFLGPGAGKVLRGAKEADRALAAGELLGVGQAFMGKAYGAAARGLSAGGAAFVDKTLGPVTSGVFHAIGTRSYNALKNGAADLNPEFGQRFVEAFAIGSGQLTLAVIARYLAEDATASIKAAMKAAAVAGEDVVAASKRALGAQPQDIEGAVRARLFAQRRVGADELERRSEELLRRTAPDFLGHSDEARFVVSRDKLAAITGMSPEDAARVLGGKADLRTAQTIHLAFYGKSGDDLARAKALLGAEGERYTLVGEDTLTHERALDILSGKADLVSGVDQFSILRNQFGNTAYDHEKVRAFVQKLVDENALTRAVLAPITGKDKLPPALKAWQRQYEKQGYTIGFAPKDGWKTVVDEAGDVIYAEPFVHFTSEADPVTMRNPLGRFMDSLFRGTTQTTIIAQSRARMVKVTRAGKISPNEARAIHQKILQTAADAGDSPRGLSLRGSKLGQVYEDIFREVLGKERYDEFVKTVDPSFAVMWAFKGEAGTVGLTQAFTGSIKTMAAHRNPIAAIAEGIYPKVRFGLSPLFQAQELTESPFFNLLRGVRKRTVSPEMQEVYEQFADNPDFKYLDVAGHVLHISGSKEVARTMTAQNTRLGKVLSRVPNVMGRKERERIAQVFHEQPEAFEEAVNAINPKLWATMVKHYGTKDARVIAESFIKERMALASGNLDEAMAVFDAAKPVIDSHDMETVWQAYRESFRQVSEQAFKTHYFNPKRGFLERTINHPYLGIYPASYMWGKVLPEFARFLLVRPFGLNAPLVGLAAYQRVQQAVVAALATDQDFTDWVTDSSKPGDGGVLYLISQLLPGTPENLPANAPAWARHLSNDLTDLQGNPRYKSGPREGQLKQFDPQEFAVRETRDAAGYAFGPARTVSVVAGALGDLGDLTGDLFADLTRSAEKLDAQYPRVGVPKP